MPNTRQLAAVRTACYTFCTRMHRRERHHAREEDIHALPQKIRGE